MNYVAHCLLAEEQSPEFRFGSMAPDLVGMAGCNMLRIKDDGVREVLSPTELDVQKGIDFHILTDRVFGEQESFKILKRKFSNEVAVQFFPQGLRLTRMFADIGTELLLDGYVMERWPQSIELYRGTVMGVGRLAMGIATTRPEAFIEITKSKKGRLPDYSDPETVAGILSWRVKNRPRLAIEPDLKPNLVRALEMHKPNVWEYGESLFLQTKDDVDAALAQAI